MGSRSMERHLDLLGKKRSRASQDGWVGPQGVVTSNELTEAELIEERVQERLQQARSALDCRLPSWNQAHDEKTSSASLLFLLIAIA